MAEDNSIPTKTCIQCKNAFPATKDYFHTKKQIRSTRNPLGLNPRCYKCAHEYLAEYLKGRKPRETNRHTTKRPDTKDVIAHRIRLRHNNRFVKLQALQAYSADIPFCECCGDTGFEFLTIDHIANDGAEHRRKIGRQNMYTYLRQQGYPPGYRVLCMNCNFSIGAYGYCPHQSLGVDISTLKPKYRRTKYWDSMKDLKRKNY